VTRGGTKKKKRSEGLGEGEGGREERVKRKPIIYMSKKQNE
jgi:hypothetical protein